MLSVVIDLLLMTCVITEIGYWKSSFLSGLLDLIGDINGWEHMIGSLVRNFTFLALTLHITGIRAR